MSTVSRQSANSSALTTRRSQVAAALAASAMLRGARAMEVLVRRLRSLADARTLYAYDRECQGLGQLLEKGCNQMAPQPAPRRRRGGGATHAPGAAGAGAAGPGASGPLVPALAAALATGLRLLFPRGGAAGWEPEAAPPTAAEAVGSLAEAFMQTSGLHESSGGESGGFPVWPDDALMRLLQQTGGWGCLTPAQAQHAVGLGRGAAATGQHLGALRQPRCWMCRGRSWQSCKGNRTQPACKRAAHAVGMQQSADSHASLLPVPHARPQGSSPSAPAPARRWRACRPALAPWRGACSTAGSSSA